MWTADEALWSLLILLGEEMSRLEFQWYSDPQRREGGDVHIALESSRGRLRDLYRL